MRLVAIVRPNTENLLLLLHRLVVRQLGRIIQADFATFLGARHRHGHSADVRTDVVVIDQLAGLTSAADMRVRIADVSQFV